MAEGVKTRLDTGIAPAILEALSHPVVLLTPTGVVAWSNRAVSDWTGLPPEALAKAPLRELFRLYDGTLREPGLLEDRLAALGENQSIRFDCHLLCAPTGRDAGFVPVEVSFARIDRAGHVLATIVKKSEDKCTREPVSELRTGPVLDKLAATLSHDFNNLLGAMTGAISVLKRGVTQGTLPQIELLEKCIERASALSLKLSCLSRGHGEQAERIVVEVVDEALKLVVRAGPARVSVDVRKGCGNAVIRGHREHLCATILELVENAIEAGAASIALESSKYSIGPGHPLEFELPPGSYVQISVLDDGEGLSEEAVQKATQIFFTTKRDHCGVGLSVATAVVKGHSGLLKIAPIEFPPGASGARASIVLPLAK